jgi:hypothetical protein
VPPPGEGVVPVCAWGLTNEVAALPEAFARYKVPRSAYGLWRGSRACLRQGAGGQLSGSAPDQWWP